MLCERIDCRIVQIELSDSKSLNSIEDKVKISTIFEAKLYEKCEKNDGLSRLGL